MEGFGSELSLTAVALIIGKWIKEVLVARRERKRVVKVVESNGGNPGPDKGGSSTSLVLHLVTEHGVKLTDLGKDMTKVKVNLAKVNTKLDIKD